MRSPSLSIDMASLRAAEGLGSLQAAVVYPVTRQGRWLFTDSCNDAGDITAGRVYAPDVEPGLLQAFVALETDDEVEAFVRRFGPVGFGPYVARGWAHWPESPDDEARRVLRIVEDGARYDRTAESIAWVLELAALMRWVREAWFVYGERRPTDGRWVPTAAIESPCPAPQWRKVPWVPDAVGLILTQHCEASRLSISVKPERLVHGLRGECLADALWLRLLYELEAQRLARCARDECRRVFAATEDGERQRYCPVPDHLAFDAKGRRRPSPCAEIVRQRELRKRRAQQGLTSRGTQRQRATAASTARKMPGNV